MNKIYKILGFISITTMLLLYAIPSRAATVTANVSASSTNNVINRSVFVQSIIFTNVTANSTNGIILWDSRTTNVNFIVPAWTNYTYTNVVITNVVTNVLTGVSDTNVYNGLSVVTNAISTNTISYPVLFTYNITNTELTVTLGKVAMNGVTITSPNTRTGKVIIVYSDLR